MPFTLWLLRKCLKDGINWRGGYYILKLWELLVLKILCVLVSYVSSRGEDIQDFCS